MKKWRCKVCGYVHTGDNVPDICPICKATNEWVELDESEGFVTAHKVGQAKGLDDALVSPIKEHFNSDALAVGVYFAMARQADREGFPEIAEAFKRYALEKADHAARFAEMLGDALTNSTEKNLEAMIEAESKANKDKNALAKKATELNKGFVHDSVHEMAKDEARLGCGLQGLLKRHFR